MSSYIRTSMRERKYNSSLFLVIRYENSWRGNIFQLVKNFHSLNFKRNCELECKQENNTKNIKEAVSSTLKRHFFRNNKFSL